jgi:hypothetical protein
MKWKSEDYKEFLNACKTEALDSRETISDIWDNCWDIYRNQQDYTEKEAWQSQVCLPEGMGAVRKAQLLIKAPLNGEFFNITGGPKAQDVKTRIEELYRDVNVSFVPNIVEAIGSGLVFGVCIVKSTYRMVEKVTVEATRDGKISHVSKSKPLPQFEVKDPRTTFFLVDDPYRFIIEEEMYSLSDVLGWANQKDKGYDKKAIKEMQKDDYGNEPTDEVKDRLRDLDIDETSNLYRKQVLIQRYWGDITDESGEKLHENVYFELANGQYLILPPKKNPYWHKKIPFVICSPLQVIFRKTGQSILEGMRTIQFSMNNIVNLQLDALLYELLGIPEIDSNKLLNPNEITALVPGRLIRRSSTAPPGPAVTIERPTSFSNAPITMMELLRRSAQNSHFVTDIVMGMPTIQGQNATATEITRKGGESTQAFQGIANEFEDNLLIPLLEMSISNLLQYDDFIDTSNEFLLPYKLMSRGQRVAMLQGDYKLEARGISSFFEMQQNLQNIVSILQIMKQIPIGSMAIKWPNMLKELFANSRIPHAELLLMTEQEMAEQIKNQQGMQLMKEQQQISLEQERQKFEAEVKMAIQQLQGQYKLAEVKEKGKQQIHKEIVKMMGEPEPQPNTQGK